MASRPLDVGTSVPGRAGIGLRAPHDRDVLDLLPGIEWLEAHSKNDVGAGGRPRRLLDGAGPSLVENPSNALKHCRGSGKR